jgi:hypothetical protein
MNNNGMVGALALVVERRGAYRVLVNLRERDHLEDQGVDGSSGSGMGVRTGFILLTVGTGRVLLWVR